MTTQEATYFLLNKIRTIYEEGEASQITDWVMENLTGSKKAERMIYKNAAITAKEEVQLQQLAERLMQHEPVQYVLHEAWFCGLKFYVDKNVLIPRPETEELVEWVAEGKSILDIGTGSGCIAVALKKKFPEATIFACDVSESALEIAKENAKSNKTDIEFIACDFLDKEKRNVLPKVDIIVSNPPYIPLEDKVLMRKNVLDFEPHLALFVNNDPLLFYKIIADFSLTHLLREGKIYLEIHEEYSEEIKNLLQLKGFKEITIRNDMQSKHRFVSAKL